VGIRIRKGDKVEVISGDDRGVRGEVMRVLPKQNRVVIAGVNVVSKHQRPIRAGRGEVQPGIIEFEAPVHISNVMPVCPSCNEPTRVGHTVQGERKVRLCRKCGQVMD
jgi:large subunit ribosomal protein L24